tara:strand:- start:677 stop:1732 length:1056 start_codon:yes stop_codon:yes gene_type:complete
MAKKEEEEKGKAEEIVEEAEEEEVETLTAEELEGPKKIMREEEEEEEKGAAQKHKRELVVELVNEIKKSKTVLIASTKSLPSSQFQQIKKKLRGKVDIRVVKKSIILRAIGKIEKGVLQNLKENIGADVALFFSDLDAFELSGLLSENRSPSKAKAGDIAPEDVEIEPGTTDLMPGPAISELSGVGLKVAVEDGKIVIKKGAVIVKKGEEIEEAKAGVMAKLGIEPMKVGFEPLAAYDANDDKVYVGIKIDKERTLEELRSGISKALGFAVNVGFVNEKTVGFFIGKAGVEEKALAKLVEEKSAKPEEEKKEEVKEEKVEEKKEEPKKEEVEEVKEEVKGEKSESKEEKNE